ncbi:protein YhfH [Aquibacillus saliphilus]
MQTLASERIESKYCTDCGNRIDSVQLPYFNQCDKCLRDADHD